MENLGFKELKNKEEIETIDHNQDLSQGFL